MLWLYRLEQELTPALKKMAIEIRSDFPDLRVSVHSSSIGSRTALQGHSWTLECLFPGALDDDDEVGVSINVAHITTNPSVTAEVAWGSSGKSELELFATPVALTPAVFEEIRAALPSFESALKRALIRGRPPERL